MNIYSTSLTEAGSFSLTAAQGAMFLSVQAADSSSFTFLGGLNFDSSFPPPSAITLSTGVSVAAKSTQAPLDGVTVTWVSGTVNIIVGF